MYQIGTALCRHSLPFLQWNISSHPETLRTDKLESNSGRYHMIKCRYAISTTSFRSSLEGDRHSRLYEKQTTYLEGGLGLVHEVAKLALHPYSVLKIISMSEE